MSGADGLAEEDAVLRARRTSPYSAREKIGRLLWAMVQGTLFRLSFHNWYGWRRMLLRAFGARLDATANVRRTVLVECPWNLSMGAESSVGDRAAGDDRRARDGFAGGAPLRGQPRLAAARDAAAAATDRYR